jgi:hypothetical protein
MSKKADSDFLRLRALARALLLEHGTALRPGAQTRDSVDDLIGDLVARQQPMLAGTTAALEARIPDRDLEIAISNHGGTLMAAYGDAGYWIGLSVGVELAALTYAGAITAQAAPCTTRKDGER